MKPDDCYQPGWDEGPGVIPEVCVLSDWHMGDHVSINGYEWPVTYTVEDDGVPADVTMSATEAVPSGD